MNNIITATYSICGGRVNLFLMLAYLVPKTGASTVSTKALNWHLSALFTMSAKNGRPFSDGMYSCRNLTQFGAFSATSSIVQLAYVLMVYTDFMLCTAAGH